MIFSIIALLYTAYARCRKPVPHRLLQKKSTSYENELEGRSTSRNPPSFLESQPAKAKVPCLFQHAFLG